MNPAKLAKALTGPVNTLLVAMALAEALAERMAAIDRLLLTANEYTDQYSGERITDPSKTWHLSDEEAPIYYALRDLAIAKAGFDLEPDYCPALIAASDQRDCEKALIEAAREFPAFAHMTTERLLCGTKDKRGLEMHREYLDLLIGMVVNAPGYTATADSLIADITA